ncbi:MAG: DUF167 domain-containing protein [Candidatus Nealsonbacteria bacterium]
MLIRVKVFPSSKKEEILKTANGGFKVRVKEKPIKGLANKGVVRALSAYFKISESKIRLVKGFRKRNKMFEVPDGA